MYIIHIFLIRTLFTYFQYILHILRHISVFLHIFHTQLRIFNTCLCIFNTCLHIFNKYLCILLHICINICGPGSVTAKNTT
jgi:hypothetical protein